MSNELKVYISNYDSYQSTVLRLDHLYGEVDQVPVVRIYGIILIEEDARDVTLKDSENNTPTGVNVLIHLHNCLPYVYVNCYENEEWVRKCVNIKRVVRYIEESLYNSFKKSRTKDDEDEIIDISKPSPRRRFVGKVSVCKGTPVYGYHVGYQLFYKISLLSPLYKTRLSNLLQSNEVNIHNFLCGKDKQTQNRVYEAHLPFTMQVFADYNLFACGWMNIKNFYFRCPVLSENNVGTEAKGLESFIKKIVKHNNVLLKNGFSRIGKTLLEIDITSESIENRSSVREKDIHNCFPDSNISLDSEIYLTSLGYLYEDLKYQCLLKNASLPNSQFSQDSLTEKEETWKNIKELRDLLDYAVVLTRTTSARSFGEYSSSVLKNNTFRGIPSIFGLVDIERNTKTKYRLLLGRDLEKWSNLNSLIMDTHLYPGLDNVTNGPLQVTDNKRSTHFELACEQSKSIHRENDSILIEKANSTPVFSHASGIISNNATLDNESCILAKSKSMDLQRSYNNSTNNDQERLYDSDGSIDDVIDESISSDIEVSAIDKNNIKDDNNIYNDNCNNNDNNTDNVNNNDNDNDNHNDNDNNIDNSNDNDNDNDNDDVRGSVHSNDNVKSASNDLYGLENDTYMSDADIYHLSQRRIKKRRLSSISDSQIASFLVSQNEQNVYVSFSPSQFLGTSICGNPYEVLLPQMLSKHNIMESFTQSEILGIEYQDPFFDNLIDASDRLANSRRKNLTKVHNESTIPVLRICEDRIPVSYLLRNQIEKIKKGDELLSSQCTLWEYSLLAPPKSEVLRWCKNFLRSSTRTYGLQNDILASLILSSKDTSSEKISRNPHLFNRLTYFHLEIHVSTKKHLLPDPEKDNITVLFYDFQDPYNPPGAYNRKGVLICMERNLSVEHKFGKSFYENNDVQIEIFDDEKRMVYHLISLVEHFDPDILSGYEINASSWGFVIERFSKVYNINLLFHLSRCNFKSNGKRGDRWGYTHTSSFWIVGRYVLNIWRLLRSELSLYGYSLENVILTQFHQTLPRFTNRQLSEWLSSSNYSDVEFVLNYYLRRMEMILKLIEFKELILKNVEQARIIGVDFNSIFYRGSQFKVESILSRLARSENLLLDSISKQQVHEMRPLECIPLVMEPDARFFKSPLLVLDFQSLYPSIIIAYNYCFSTIIARLSGFRQHENEVGYLKNLSMDTGMLDILKKNKALQISPNGCVFVKASVRKSLLAKMLEEILNMRISVKSVMKLFNADSEVYKLYNSKQLALKLIANVTYGYTSATFSGRMPNSDIADAIVSTGREILTQSVKYITEGGFGANVVYGDTDSLFVYLPGRSRMEAFEVGNKITTFISDKFPNPIKLKLEKVYHPCILLAKKRYVGYSYESPQQSAPRFDAKGLETVRRDGIPAQQKIVRQAIEILFETKNVSRVKKYAQDFFQNIMNNNVSIQDFCFAKEVRFGTYKKEAYLPPGAIVANKAVLRDSRSEPQYRERVPYVVFRDKSLTRLKDRCISPEEFILSLSEKPLSLDYEYYIKNVLLPPLSRFFILMGVDVFSWYKDMPVIPNDTRIPPVNDLFPLAKFFKSNSCLGCGSQLDQSFCETNARLCGLCRKNELKVLLDFSNSVKYSNMKVLGLENRCKSCLKYNFVTNDISTLNKAMACINTTCPIYYKRIKHTNEYQHLSRNLEEVLQELDKT